METKTEFPFNNTTVTYNNANDTVNWKDTILSWDWYDHDYHTYYTPNSITNEDKFEKAFNIAKLLLKEKLLVSRKLMDFISLVEKIAEEL